MKEYEISPRPELPAEAVVIYPDTFSLPLRETTHLEHLYIGSRFPVQYASGHLATMLHHAAVRSC